MRVLIVYDCEFPWDIRVEKTAQSFIQEGWETLVLARNMRGESRKARHGKVEVRRMPAFGATFLTGMINITLFFNPIWLFSILRYARGCDLIIVRDLPLAVAGNVVAKILKIPLMVDFAEPYPLTLKQRRSYEPFRPHHLIVRNIAFAVVLEWLTIRISDRLIVVCAEAANRLAKKGVPENKIVVVHNTPVLPPKCESSIKPPALFNSLKNRFVVLYVGFLIGGRGLEVAIEAVGRAVKKVPHLALVIAGSGKAHRELREMVRELKLEDHVFFSGWVSHEQVPDYIASCHIGILPFHTTAHINHTVANKFFDFFAMNKSIICSDAAPMKRLIKTIGEGYVFRSGDSDHLARLFVSLARQKKKISAPLGHKAIYDQYNWSVDFQRLISQARKLVDQKCPVSDSSVTENV